MNQKQRHYLLDLDPFAYGRPKKHPIVISTHKSEKLAWRRLEQLAKKQEEFLKGRYNPMGYTRDPKATMFVASGIEKDLKKRKGSYHLIFG